MLGRDVVAVGREAAEVARTGRDERRPPVGKVRRNLDADTGEQLARRAHKLEHLVDRDRAGPVGQRELRMAADARAPVRLGGGGCDLGGLLAVVAAVRDEVLEDQLLDVAVAVVQCGERLERLDAIGVRLADADEDAARERDAQLAGVADRLQAQRGSFVGEPACAVRSARSDSSIRPWEAVTSRRRARSERASAPRLVCGRSPRSSARSQHQTT